MALDDGQRRLDQVDDGAEVACRQQRIVRRDRGCLAEDDPQPGLLDHGGVTDAIPVEVGGPDILGYS